MSPFRIQLGMLTRMIGAFILILLSVLTLGISPNALYLIASASLTIVTIGGIAPLMIKFIKGDAKTRFGISSILINLSLTLFAFLTAGLIPGLPLWIDAVLVVLAFWHALVAILRFNAYKSGSFNLRFFPKPKRPSPFQPVRDFIEKRAQPEVHS